MIHKYISVAYRLFAGREGENAELVEQVSEEHPFQFLSGLGTALDSFENRLLEIGAAGEFDFTLSVDEAFGPYVDERVLEFDRSMFEVDGHFDRETFYPGNIVPMVNADGNRFDALVLGVGEEKVRLDFNHVYAGKVLRFVGRIVEFRDATDGEVTGAINRLSHADCCSCGCGGRESGGHGSCCGHHGEKGGCCGHGGGENCGCGRH
ncbi:MAG: peptidylprolyl isomerase [Prevotellaceae bacterium]|nr:peptidylprolyl isomerase [Prevotellaceae bacterium]